MYLCHYLVPRCALKEAACDSTLPALCTHAGSLLLAQDGRHTHDDGSKSTLHVWILVVDKCLHFKARQTTSKRNCS